MIRNNKIPVIISTLLLLLPMLVGLLLWDALPDEVPMHWNAAGEVDGWGTKAQAVFLLPGLVLGIHWVCMLVTGLDPKSKNISGTMVHLVIWICPLISIVVCSLTYATALGCELSVEVLMPLLMGGLFMIIGNFLPKCRRNYTIGIKIPWTLESDENWNATHRFAGFLWVLGGGLIMATSIFGNMLVFFVIVLVMALAPTLYSYLYHRKKGTA